MTLAEAVYRQALRDGITVVAAHLQEVLGQRLVAYGVGLRNPKTVGTWARGGTPRHDAQQRLRDLYRTVLLLEAHERPDTIRAWLIGANPQLEDQAPIELLRNGEVAAVFRAAEAFTEG
jgi:hypothetical protein